MEDRISCFGINGVIPYLPPSIGEALALLSAAEKQSVTEIRLRLEQPTALGMGRKGAVLRKRNGEPLICGDAEMKTAVYRVTQGSVYALSEELRRGYITLKGGHRVGLGGRTLLEGGRVVGIRDISSLNFRVAHAVASCGKKLLPYLLKGDRFCNTLLFSPPCAGKTTLLRDLTALYSDMGKNVALVDERSEIAGSFLGRPQLWVGRCTDVLDGAPKAEGMMMAIRSLNPELLVTDEIGGEEEALPILEAVNSGIALLLTAHAGTLEELKKRPLLRRLLAESVFQRLVCLGATPFPGTLRHIYNERGEAIC